MSGAVNARWRGAPIHRRTVIKVDRNQWRREGPFKTANGTNLVDVLSDMGHVTTEMRGPSTPLQALMEAPPGDEPEVSIAERKRLAEAVATAIEAMPQPYRSLVERYYYRGESIRQIAKVRNYSRMTAQRRLVKARLLLEAALQVDPTVEAYLARFNGGPDSVQE